VVVKWKVRLEEELHKKLSKVQTANNKRYISKQCSLPIGWCSLFMQIIHEPYSTNTFCFFFLKRFTPLLLDDPFLVRIFDSLKHVISILKDLHLVL